MCLIYFGMNTRRDAQAAREAGAKKLIVSWIHFQSPRANANGLTHTYLDAMIHESDDYQRYQPNGRKAKGPTKFMVAGLRARKVKKMQERA